MRVYNIASKYKISSKELIEICKTLGIKNKKPMSGLTEEEKEKIEKYFENKKIKKTYQKKDEKPQKIKEQVQVEEKTIQEGIKKIEEKIEEKKIEIEEVELPKEIEEIPENLKPRAPVVTIMGHVDHGKTTILDAIRKSRVAEKEYGQITQKIGAYKVVLPEGSIVFLDTPGHEAFTSIRARGTQITDIVVLVVAADEGVKPQTIEAINHAKSAKVPIIVAINKIDKPNINPDRVKKQLSEYGLVPEEWGGDTVFVNVSGLKGTGLKELLEMILIVAGMLDLKANPDIPGEGVIIESQLHKTKGPTITVLIQNGKIKVGDIFVAGETWGKVRALIDDWGNKIIEAGPSTPVEILGSHGVVPPGSKFKVVPSEKEAKNLVEKLEELKKSKPIPVKKITLEDLYNEMKKGELKEIKLILKADYIGSIEAIKNTLEKLSNGDVKISVIHAGTGPITESDILLASASNGIVFGFNVPYESKVEEVAKKEGVEVKNYQIIYDLIDEVKKAMEGMLEPMEQEVLNGQALVKKVFNVSKNVIAGCLVVDGKVIRDSNVKIIRDGKIIYEGILSSLKRFKDSVKEVLTHTECGIGINGFKDFKEGDIIQSYTKIKVPRKLKGS